MWRETVNAQMPEKLSSLKGLNSRVGLPANAPETAMTAAAATAAIATNRIVVSLLLVVRRVSQSGRRRVKARAGAGYRAPLRVPARFWVAVWQGRSGGRRARTAFLRCDCR